MSKYDQETYERIERYLLEELPEEERAAFERRLAEDSSFAEAVDRYRLLFEAVTDDQAMAFRSKVTALQQRVRQQREARRPVLWRRLLAAAALIALAVALAWLLFPRPEPDRLQELYAFAEAQGWPVYPSALFPEAASRREADDSPVDSLQAVIAEIQTAYSSGNYTVIPGQLARLPVDSIGADRYYFYLGVAQLRSGQPAPAARSFERIEGGPFRAAAQWNRALALLGAGRVEEAAPMLETMAQSGDWQEEARQLLDKLDGF